MMIATAAPTTTSGSDFLLSTGSAAARGRRSDFFNVGRLIVGSLIVGSWIVGSLIVGSLIVGSLIVGSLIAGSLKLNRDLVGSADLNSVKVS